MKKYLTIAVLTSVFMVFAGFAFAQQSGGMGRGGMQGGMHGGGMQGGMQHGGPGQPAHVGSGNGK